MAAYIEKAKRMRARIDDLVKVNNISVEVELAIYRLIFSGMKCMPRVMHQIKTNAMHEIVGRDNKRIVVKNVRKKEFNGDREYDTIDFFEKPKANPFE